MALLGFSRSCDWYTAKNAFAKQWCRSRECNYSYTYVQERI